MTKNVILSVLIVANLALGVKVWLRHERIVAQCTIAEANRATIEAGHLRLLREKEGLTVEHKKLVAAVQSSNAAVTTAESQQPKWEQRPEVKEVRRRDTVHLVGTENRLLFSRLNLDPKARETLDDLLVARQLNREAASDDGRGADQEFRERAMAELSPADAAIAIDMVLDNPDAWREVATLDQALRYEGKVMNTEQLQGLADRLKTVRPATPRDPDALEHMLQQRQATNSQIIEEARAFLTPAQTARLQAELQDGLAQQRVELYRRMQLQNQVAGKS